MGLCEAWEAGRSDGKGVLRVQVCMAEQTAGK